MISDGYTGNIMLKTAEGMSDFITSNLKKVFVKSFTNKIKVGQHELNGNKIKMGMIYGVTTKIRMNMNKMYLRIVRIIKNGFCQMILMNCMKMFILK